VTDKPKAAESRAMATPSFDDEVRAGTSDVSVRAESTIDEVVARAITDPSIDVERLQRLLEFQKDRMAYQAMLEFNEAMVRAQEEIQPVARTTENIVTRSWYAKLEAVDAAIRPIYLRHGFSLSYNSVEPLTPGNIRMECRCARGVHVERYYREASPDTMGPKGTPTKTSLHGGASTETFLKRYLTCGIFNVVFKDQDDDGVGGTIDAAQADHLRMLLAKTDRPESSFLKYMRVQSIEEITNRDYPKAVSALNERIKPNKEEQE
jgi:hypothetical protein